MDPEKKRMGGFGVDSNWLSVWKSDNVGKGRNKHFDSTEGSKFLLTRTIKLHTDNCATEHNPLLPNTTHIQQVNYHSSYLCDNHIFR